MDTKHRRRTLTAWIPMLGAVLLTLSGCFGGGSDVPDSPQRAPLTLVATPDHLYASVKGGAGSTLEYFRRADGSLDQATYSNATTGERVQLLYGNDGLPERLVDLAGGTTVVIARVSDSRTDFRSFDAAGTYIGGHALRNDAGTLSVVPIRGQPSFSGQLRGQLNGNVQTGSFSLLPTSGAGLGTPVVLSAAQLALVDALVAATTPAVAAGPSSALAASAIDRRAVVGGLVGGVLVGTASGNPAVALLAGATLSYGLEFYLLPVIDGVNAATTLEELPDALNPLLNSLDNGEIAEAGVMAALLGNAATTISGVLARAFDAALDVLGALLDRATLPDIGRTLPLVSTAVSGFGVDQLGIGYNFSGDVSPTGAVSLAGTPSDGGASILATGVLDLSTGKLAGAVTGRIGAGSIVGDVVALGACATLTQSGGAGTFSYAFDAAATTGKLSFYRQAYSIPDGFRVLSNGKTLYDTGGLVSGDETVNLALVGSRILFVLVNAPTSGTAWDLKVGCPS